MADLPAGVSSHTAAITAALAFLFLLTYAVGGRWRTPYERASVLTAQNRIIVLAMLSVVWVMTEWALATAPEARQPSVVLFLREAADWGRQAAACWLLIHLLSPHEPLKTTAHGRRIANACMASLAMGALGAGLHAVQPQLKGLTAWLPALAMVVMLLALLEQVLRNAQADDRWSLAPLSVGLGLGFAFDLYRHAEALLMGMPAGQGDLLRTVVHASGVPLLALSVRRQVGNAVRVRVSRQIIFYTGAITLAGAVLLLMSVVGTWVRYFDGDWGPAVQVLMLTLGLMAVAMVGLSGSLRARLRVTLTKHFFHYRYDYREEWLRYTSLLGSPSSPGEIGVQVVQGLANMVECASGSLWLRGTGAHGRAVFRQQAHWNDRSVEEELDAQVGLPEFLQRTGWVVDLQEWQEHRTRYGSLTEMPNVFLQGANPARLVIPLSVNGQSLEGFVVLQRPRAVLDLDWEVRDLLKTAARQAASYLAYMQATSELLEARKFEAFNRMSAFVVHDLKNIVTQLSLMLRNAQRLQDNPAFRADMLMTVESSVEKMRQLMTQLREGAQDETARPVDLAALLHRLQDRARQRGRTVELHHTPRVATRGSQERLERVLGHLVDNALDATPPEGRVWLDLQRGPSQACVVVGDTGHGMSEDFMKNRLFQAFSTTKTEGMGIGMHESLQYVRELGGRIEPRSTEGQGTVMTVWLPLLQADLNTPLPLEKAA